ncbi:FliM/FliN family flagellar motor switch protein [Pantoea ananatis]|uniref:FliM/FliN family flagellar motor switch protein n=1 Tax=Pantoea ananas TaxID=553 RepID=UPI0024AD5564|nr:FliM/FliN family flagellar motor switch protein [Pantoea ananatis]MDI6539611.1 FliM/FliN family flagellar motor switch protein [Pantoea ananatis]
MSLFHRLRRYDFTRTMLERQQANNPGSAVIEPSASARYLYLSLINPDMGEAEAMIDLDEWLEKTDLQMPGVPWHDVPLSYLVRWLREMQVRFLVKNSLWEVQHLIAVDCELPARLLLVPAEPCPLMCFQRADNLLAPQTRQNAILPAITFDLDYVLGNSTLLLSALVNINTGDLLLIKDYQPRLKVGGRQVFTFVYNHHQEIIVDQPLQDGAPDVRDEDEVLFQWTQLPVSLEFVLDRQTVTLAELEEINPGSVLSVSAAAEQKVKIYINRKLFASGELVTLEGDRLGVEINQLSQHVNTVTGTTDAE